MNRIDGVNPLTTSRTQHGAAAGVAEATLSGRGPRDGVDGRRDALSVSERGRIVARAAVAVQGAPDARDARVAALKAAIAAGTYEIDAEAVARRLIANGLHQG
ncbi:MAG: hypothetical protein Kow0010_19380 [Dehalococcoidia bacterium]